MKKQNNKGFSVVEVLVIILIVGLLAVLGWLFYNNTKQNEAEPAPQVTDFMYDGIDVPSDWKTYENENYGFSFQYPSNSSVAQDEMELGESDDKAIFVVNVSPNKHPAYVVSVLKTSLSEAVKNNPLNTNENAYSDTIKQDSIYVSGHRATELSYTPESGKYSQFFIEKDTDTIIVFSGVNDSGEFAEESKAIYNSLVIK